MRRWRSSSRPAFPSKNHLSPFFTIGTGNGQSSSPTRRNALFPLFGSTETLFFSRASATKLAACCWSCAYSPDRTMSSPPGPKIWSNALTSNFSAASISASAARCGVSKLRVSTVEAAGVAGGFCMADCGVAKETANREAEATVQPNQRYFAKGLFTDVDSMPVLRLVSYLRRPPPPRPPPPRLKPPPPPRDPMLEEPRLLLARALDPL